MASNPSLTMYIFTQKTHKFPRVPGYKTITSLSDEAVGIDYLDNCGDNINVKNKYYAEYTKLYWIWKNAPKTDMVGFCQYRRYFWLHKSNDDMVQITKDTITEVEPYISTEAVPQFMQDYDILLTPLHVYTFETVCQQYSGATCTEHIHLEQLEQAIKKVSPEYLPACRKVLASHYCYTCNMFITRWEIFDAYMSWYFSICRELEKRIVLPQDPLKWRVYAFLGERMLDMFVEYHQLKAKGMPMVFLNGKAEAGYTDIKSDIRKDDLTYIYSVYGFAGQRQMPDICQRALTNLRHHIADLCHRYKHLYIYGAGLYGRLLNVLLAEQGRSADLFIVTDKTANEQVTDGIRAIGVEELPNLEPGIIIIGIKSKVAQGEIAAKLKKNHLPCVMYDDLLTEA